MKPSKKESYIEGAQALRKRLKRMPNIAKTTVDKALKKSAIELRDLAQFVVPVDTGDLKESIRVINPYPLFYIVRAGDEKAKARVVEFLHNPTGDDSGYYLFPSQRLLKPRQERRMKTALRKVVKLSAGN